MNRIWNRAKPSARTSMPIVLRPEDAPMDPHSGLAKVIEVKTGEAVGNLQDGTTLARSSQGEAKFGGLMRFVRWLPFIGR